MLCVQARAATSLIAYSDTRQTIFKSYLDCVPAHEIQPGLVYVYYSLDISNAANCAEKFATTSHISMHHPLRRCR
eukprot:6183510-Pleurochrysis_carterae.AAC.2